MGELNLDELEELRAKATQEAVWFSVAGDHETREVYEDHGRIIDFMAESIRKGSGPWWFVAIDEPTMEEHARTVAATGNGPTGEANARYLTALLNSAPELLALAGGAAEATKRAEESRLELSNLTTAGERLVRILADAGLKHHGGSLFERLMAVGHAIGQRTPDLEALEEATKRADEAEAEVVRKHGPPYDPCWFPGPDGRRVLEPGACSICCRVLGKGEG